MVKHPRMIEAIKMAKVAATSNRGMYPFTVAANVYKQDGTALEDTATTTVVEILEPDVVVDPEVETIANVLEQVESGAVIALTDSAVAEEIVLTKGVVLQGTNAGIPQNHAQEV